MHDRTTQLLGGDVLVAHGLDDLGAGEEHVGLDLDHDDEVGQGRRVDGATGAGPEDTGDLRDNARGEYVAGEDFGVAGQRFDTFLNTGATGVIQADDRNAHLDAKVHDLADLFSQGLGQRTGENGKVLRVHVDRPAGQPAVTGDDTIAEELDLLHAEIVAAMQLEGIVLFKGAGVEQGLNALAGGFFAFLVDLVDLVLTPAQKGLCPLLLQLLQFFLCTHAVSLLQNLVKIPCSMIRTGTVAEGCPPQRHLRHPNQPL